jgi:hypothetical protein
MGEYAIRKSDGVEIKIGTCEDMYYIRFEDRDKVSALRGNVDIANDPDGSRFRLPFPDEDDVLPGEYHEYNRGLRLYRMVEGPPYLGPNQEPTEHCEDWKDESAANHPGVIQLHHQDAGLLVNLPCYHGIKLPELIEGAGGRVSTFWNGKGHSFVLSSVKCIKSDGDLHILQPVIRCRHCDEAWRYTWAEVLPWVGDTSMRARLEKYAAWELSTAVEGEVA